MMMDINYLIQVHQYPEHLKRLIHRLNGEGVYFYIHLDKKVDIAPFQEGFEAMPNVIFIKERLEVTWGHISQVWATFNTIKNVLQDQRHGYCVLMSGQDYPIKPVDYIRNFLEGNYGINFIESRPIAEVWPNYEERINQFNFHPNTREKTRYIVKNVFNRNFYTRPNLYVLKKLVKANKLGYLKYIFKVRKHPKDLKPFAGSSWWALPMESVRLFMDFLKRRDYLLKYHEHTHCPDEILFQTVINHLFPRKKIEDCTTHVNWTKKNVPLPVTFEDEGDFLELRQSNCLFARKFKEGTKILDDIDREMLGVN